MYAFSQPPAGGRTQVRAYENIELGVGYLGFSNQTSYQDYRYFQFDMQATYDITLTRVPYMGSPIFYVKMMDSASTRSARASDYDFKSKPHQKKPKSVQILTLDE